MKILFFVSSMEDGGAQRVISILSDKLTERGFSVSILKYFKTVDLFNLNDKVKTYSVEENTGTTNTVRNLGFIHKEFKKYDVVLSFLAPFNMIALVANLFNKTPIIVADRNDPSKVPSNKYVRFVRDLLYKLADRIVVQTKHNQAYFKKNTDVIYNPVVMDDFKGMALRVNKEKLIVSSARLEKQKNQEMLIDSFDVFHKNHPEYKLVIYGEGSYRKNLEEKIDKLGLNGCILLPGVTKDIFNKIATAELFVLTSNYEGMPNALIEAMCLGLPVISTKVSGATDLIRHMENGMLVDLNDVESLSKYMEELIENKELAVRLGNEAVKLNDLLNANRITDEWVRVINQLTDKEN